MADDDGPTQPGVPFDPAETEDGPTLQVYVPERPLPRPPRAPGAPSPRDAFLGAPGLDTATLPRLLVAAELDETLTLERSTRSAPIEIGDADETLTLRRPEQRLDEVATTKLAPAPVRVDFPLPPPSEQTRPFALIPAPTATAPFPLVRRDQTESLPDQPMLAPPVMPPAFFSQQPPPAPAPPLGHEQRAVLVFAASVLATLAVALVITVVVLAGRSSKRSPVPADTLTAPAQPGGAAAGGCSVQHAPKLIATAIVPAVPLTPAAALSPGEVAVGFAESREAAVGIVVDLSDSSVERRFSESRAQPVARVTPFERDGSLKFLVDREGGKLTNARSVPANPPFAIGTNYFGLARTTSGEPETIWPGGKGVATTELMLASVPRVGHAVTFARGRFGGSVHAGWITDRGRPSTELGALDVTAYEVGSPTIAAGPSQIAVAVAVRDAEISPSRVLLASAAHGKVPKSVVSLTSGAGPDRVHPVISSLADGGWLVAWIEGSESKSVRAQVLDRELRAVRPPFDIASGNAIEPVRGALFRVERRVLGLYVARAERGPALFASVIECE